MPWSWAVCRREIVDLRLCQGTCHKEGNWTKPDSMAGHVRAGRNDYEEHVRLKRLRANKQCKDTHESPRSKKRPKSYVGGEVDPKARCPLKAPQRGCLFEPGNAYATPSYGLSARMCAAVVVSGARDDGGIDHVVQRLSKQQHQRLRGWKRPCT